MIKNLKNKKKINFFKKNFIKIVRKLGFEIIDQNNFTIPTSNTSLNNNISVINKRNITLPLGEIKVTRKIVKYRIVNLIQIALVFVEITLACPRYG